MKNYNLSFLLKLLALAAAIGALAAAVAWKWETIEKNLRDARKLYCHESLIHGIRYRRALKEEYKDYADVDFETAGL